MRDGHQSIWESLLLLILVPTLLLIYGVVVLVTIVIDAVKSAIKPGAPT